MPRSARIIAVVSAALVAALAVPVASHAEITYPHQQPAPDVVNEIAYLTAGWAYATAPAVLKPCTNGVEQWQTTLADLFAPDVGSAWGRGFHADDNSQCAFWISDDLVNRLDLKHVRNLGYDLMDGCTAIAHEWLHAKGLPHTSSPSFPAAAPEAFRRVMSDQPAPRPGWAAPPFCLRWTYESVVAQFKASRWDLSLINGWLPTCVIVYARAHLRGARALLRKH